jgi:hypothetical protein
MGLGDKDSLTTVEIKNNLLLATVKEIRPVAWQQIAAIHPHCTLMGLYYRKSDSRRLDKESFNTQSQ